MNILPLQYGPILSWFSVCFCILRPTEKHVNARKNWHFVRIKMVLNQFEDEIGSMSTKLWNPCQIWNHVIILLWFLYLNAKAYTFWIANMNHILPFRVNCFCLYRTKNRQSPGKSSMWRVLATYSTYFYSSVSPLMDCSVTIQSWEF